jgi:YVTN family beta-propeller protein
MRAERRRRRRRIVGGGVVVAALAVGGAVAVGLGGSDSGIDAPAVAAGGVTDGEPTSSTSTTTPPTSTTAPPVPSDARRLTLVRTVVGDIAPKSVVASGTGLVTAQNMMYRHSVTVYDATGDLVATVDDAVDLAQFGIAGHPGVSRGAPVEAAFAPNGRHVYVTNYSMYGEGFGPEGSDACTASQRFDDSYVYRIDTRSMVVDQVIPVGAVPKYVEVTPDGEHVLVSNWCSNDLSIIDARTAAPVARVPLGTWPRGIAVDPTSSTAYVAVMGDNTIVQVDLARRAVNARWTVGTAPRHVIMGPGGTALYVTLSGDGDVVQLDPATGAEVARTRSDEPPHHDDRARRPIALRRQLRRLDHHQAGDRRPRRAPGAGDQRAPDRRDLRARRGSAVGGGLRRQPPALRRHLRPSPG